MLQLSRLMSQGFVPFPAHYWSNIPANLRPAPSPSTPKVPWWGMMIKQQSLNVHRQTPTHRLGSSECSQTKTTFHSAAGEGMQGDKAWWWQGAMSSAYVPSSHSWCSLSVSVASQTHCSLSLLHLLPCPRGQTYTYTLHRAARFSV